MQAASIELSLKLDEAAALAALLFEHCAGQHPITDDQRNRLGGRVKALQLRGIRPYPGSLQRDPVHPTSFYLAVDALHHDRKTSPLLLRIASASSPASGIFPKSQLIGRVQAGRTEAVINAIPFGPEDTANLKIFMRDVDASFQPQSQGAHSSITLLRAGHHADAVYAAVQAFRSALKTRNAPLPVFECDGASASAVIRSGWRNGHGAELTLDCTHIEAAGDALDQSPNWSRLRLLPLPLDASGDTPLSQEDRESIQDEDVPLALKFGRSLRMQEQLHDLARASRAGGGPMRPFDFAPAFPRLPANEIEFFLRFLKQRGRSAQLFSILEDPGDHLEQYLEIGRKMNCLLSVRSLAEADWEIVRSGRYRIDCRLDAGSDVLAASERLSW